MSSTDFQRRLGDSHKFFGHTPSLLVRAHIDVILCLLLLTLMVAGLTVLYSASGQNLAVIRRQGAFFAVAWVAMLLVAQVSPEIYRRWSLLLYVVSLTALVAVAFVGVGKGAQRWLDLPLLPQFQPAEIMKLALPAAVAAYISARAYPPRLKYIAVSLLLIGLPTALVLQQPDLGTGVLLMLSGLFVLFFGGLQWRYLFGVATVITASAWPAWLWLLRDYQRQRILTMFNPESDRLGAGWNIIQSKTAIGSGGLNGKGWLQGTQSHLDFLPETNTDFIIAVIAEEFGFRGVALLLILYASIIARGLWLSTKATSTFGRLFAGSVTMTFFVYLAVNMSMVSGILPVVGLPLPMVSQGGSSLITLMLGFGCVMAIATQEKTIVEH